MSREHRKTWTWTDLVFATRNRHKVKELDTIFRRALGVGVTGLFDLDVPEIVEDRDTFEGNAIKKAETIASALNRPVAADDSGLTVEALNGAPGVHSARFAGQHGDDRANNEKLLRLMEGIPPSRRQAAFVCALALAVPGEKTEVVRGECPGWIAESPRGENGFGYDPLFVLPGRGCTMAELSPEEKNRISHRARAAEEMIRLLQNKYVFPSF